MSPFSSFALALVLMAGCGNQVESASKADIGSLKDKVNILSPFGSPDCSLCGKCDGVCINDMANLSNNTLDLVASVGPWVLGEVSFDNQFAFGTICVSWDVFELAEKAFGTIDQYITVLNIQPQLGDVDNPVFCNCTGVSFLDGDEQSESFGRSICLTPIDEANYENNSMTKVTKDEIKSFFQKI